jgi:hypothetical protein
LRVPSSSAVAAPDQGDPPEAMTPTSANCDAPVNISSDRAAVCHTSSPAATPIAPKDNP